MSELKSYEQVICTADLEKLEADSDALKATLQELKRVSAQRDDLLLALEELLDACPVGFGNDRRLNEACLQAERAIDGARR